MNFKRVGVVFLLSSFVLTGCSSGSTAASSSSNAKEVNSTSSTAAAATAAAKTAAPDFSETIVDDDNVLFQIVSTESSNVFRAYGWNVYIENKTDKNLMCSLSDVSVDGYMCDPFWAKTVSAGMKANEEISWAKTTFETAGITDVTNVTFTLTVYDSDDWTADHLIDTQYTVYPQGEAADRDYPRVPVDGEETLFDNDSCTMVILGQSEDSSFYAFSENVYLENKTDHTLMFSTNDATVNGYMCDPYWAVTVAPMKKCYTSIDWSTSTFENNGITSVDTITLPIRVYDSDNWTGSNFVDDTFTLNF